jgi:hypothetical protein
MADNAENTEGAEASASETEQTNNQGNDIPPEVKRALNKANKEAEALRLKLKEFEDRDKTELERLTERAEAAERAAAATEVKALRLEVAAEQGLTPAQAKRLVGESRDELEADAKELLATFKPATTEDDSQESVTESLDLGIRSGSPKKGKSTADLFAAAIDGSFTR